MAERNLQGAAGAASRCQCGIVLQSLVSLELGKCATCRMQERATMPLLALLAKRRRDLGALGSAGELEAEVKFVQLQVRVREDIANG
ncbi:hypothetical protein [Hyalangium gracile]|uniref:hypothetical protein n=1 Tax=Hyalangium gracile TaxID=394092 RepID=UPI001CCA6226|nr:hypothetical protein [Hyalangium gracile]